MYVCIYDFSGSAGPTGAAGVPESTERSFLHCAFDAMDPPQLAAGGDSLPADHTADVAGGTAAAGSDGVQDAGAADAHMATPDMLTSAPDMPGHRGIGRAGEASGTTGFSGMGGPEFQKAMESLGEPN